MQDVLNRSYKGLMNVIDSFANSSASIQHPPSTNKKNGEELDYVYTENNYMDTILNNPLTSLTLRTIANRFYVRIKTSSIGLLRSYFKYLEFIKY